MTMDEQGAHDRLIDEALIGHLDAYDAALDPDPAAIENLRAHVLRAAEARPRRPASRLDRVRALVSSGPSGPSSAFRRPLVGLAAASLLVVLAVGGTFAATAPGAPLYGARLWLEDATLPADPAARADAEMSHLQDRLAEAEAGARSGNGAAVTAAIEAYRATLDEALQAAGGDLTREQRLQVELQRHRAVLEALVTAQQGNGNASTAIQAALDRNADAIDRILREAPAGTGTPAGGGGAGQGGQSGTHPGNGTAGPAQGGAGQGQGGAGQGQGGAGQGQGGASQGQGQGQGGAHATKAPAPNGPNASKSPDPSKKP